jgi:DNA-binding MarR family transcriptional regulator
MWTLNQSLGFHVNRLAGAMRTAMEARLVPHGLTAPQWGTLMRLLEHDGWPQRELGQSLGMDKATIGGVIARLEAKRLLMRQVDPEDARVKCVTLTAAGRKLSRALQPLAEEVNDRATATFSPREVAQLVSLLTRARSDLSA